GRHVDRGTGGDADQLRKSALPLDAHHAFRAGVAGAVFRTDVERHAARRRDPLPDLALRHAGADRVDDAGAVDAGNERQRRTAEHLLAGAQAHVEDTVDGRGMDADAHLALPRHRVRPVLVFEVFGRAELMDDVRFQLPALPSGCPLAWLTKPCSSGQDAPRAGPLELVWKPANVRRIAYNQNPRTPSMTISMYKVSVPIFVQFLTGQSNCIDKAVAHIEAKKLDAHFLFNMRFFPDMYPYSRQVQQATTHAMRCCSALAGAEMPDMPNTEANFAEL